MRVLLVDDDAGLRALLRMTFDVFDIEVLEAADAAEARLAETVDAALCARDALPTRFAVDLTHRL